MAALAAMALYVVSLAVDTTGPELGVHSLVGVGAVVVEVPTGVVVERRRWAADTDNAVWDRAFIEGVRKRTASASASASSSSTSASPLAPAALGASLRAWLHDVTAKPTASVVLVLDRAVVSSAWLEAVLGFSYMALLASRCPLVDFCSFSFGQSAAGAVSPPPPIRPGPLASTAMVHAERMGVEVARALGNVGEDAGRDDV